MRKGSQYVSSPTFPTHAPGGRARRSALAIGGEPSPCTAGRSGGHSDQARSQPAGRTCRGISTHRGVSEPAWRL